MIPALFERLAPARLADLVPELRIGRPLATDAPAVDTGELPPRGWFELRLTSTENAARLDAAVARLDAAGLPLAAIYVFDEVWSLGLGLQKAVSAALGESYELLEDLWAFSVGPGASGWPPHRGVYASLDRARPECVNAWIALSDVESDRACMHLAPLTEDQAYLGGRLEELPETGVAAPLAKGEALVWNANVAHWGGPCAKGARGPRRSLTFTLSRSDKGIDPATLDPWQRLEIVARQVLVYGAREPERMTEELHAWATATSRLADRVSGSGLPGTRR